MTGRGSSTTAAASTAESGASSTSGPEREQAAQRLRDYLDTLDQQTRRPGEPPLREAVAQQARERLDEMGAPARREKGEIRTTVPKPEHPPVGPSGVSPSPDGSR